MSGLAARQAAFLEALYGARPPADPRLAIYHRAVRANWAQALAAAYPVVRRLVGDAFFDAAAEAYACAHPSTSGDLARFGDRLPGFLASHRGAAVIACLPDVARLEWAVHESARAADAPPLDAAALARVAPDLHGRIRLVLHPSARLLESPHPVVAIWEANQPGRDGTPERFDGRDFALVHRRDGAVRPRAIDAADWRLLARLAGGETLEAACVALGARAARLPETLARYAAEGVIAGFAAQ